jgi:hypothetical protein
MAKTINFCGDSFCGNNEPGSWTNILAKSLNCKILGWGKGATAHEHAIQSFREDADITVFCWTEPHRIHHPKNKVTMMLADRHKNDKQFYTAAYLYYKYLHNSEYETRRQSRELYWFDHVVLTQYKGQIVHCWSFEQTYNFTTGLIYKTPLFEFGKEIECTKNVSPNHMTIKQNTHFALELYKIIRSKNG